MEEELTPAECREADRHKYFMSMRFGYDVGFAVAKADWLEHYAARWRSERQARMLAMQRDEINRYKWIESEKAHRDLGREAVLDWIHNNAACWREWYEHEYEGKEPEQMPLPPGIEGEQDQNTSSPGARAGV